LDVGFSRQRVQGFLAVMGKAEGELTIANLPPKPLSGQRLEIGFVIDAEDLTGSVNRVLLEKRQRETGAIASSSDRNRPAW
jgi:hypothetical protein